MFLFSRPFLFEETEAGERVVSWRVWLLIWLVPVLFAGAAIVLAGQTFWQIERSVAGQGEVVRVYAWPGETLFDRGTTNYSPVLRYENTPGEMTEASTGMSHPAWNFEIGSKMEILYTPGYKGNVMLPGPHNWAVARVIGLIALVTAVPALWAHRRVRRWQKGGRVVG
jgi:hypothetical protein